MITKTISIDIPLAEDDIYDLKDVVYRDKEIIWNFYDYTETYLVQVKFVQSKQEENEWKYIWKYRKQYGINTKY